MLQWLEHFLFIVSAEDEQLYRVYGSMLAYMFVHGGPAPKFLSSGMYDLLVKGLDTYTASISDVDPSLAEPIRKVN